jgi:Rrf2 family protein
VKLITVEMDYAARALAHIAAAGGEVVPVSRLAEQLDIPRPFLRRILQTLEKKGLVHSKKGIHGGFKLAGAASGISLMDIVRVFQGAVGFCSKTCKKGICTDMRGCVLRSKIMAVERIAGEALAKINIAQLVTSN